MKASGYHGYWITDFTSVDPHLGTNAEFKALVDAAHARGMKVYMDIITNHTADVIQFAECAGKKECVYRSRADYPYQRRGGPAGAAINRGFAGDQVRSADNFARLTDPNFAYTPARAGGRAEREGARLAQRPDLLSQPRRHDVSRRKLADRRFRRARRPVHRASARRRRA